MVLPVVLRALSTIALAIRLAQPDVSQVDAERYAIALQQQAKQYDFDPLTGVAIIYSESRFRPRAVSPDEEDFGLAQIRARHFGACKDDEDPVRYPSVKCLMVRAGLLDPEVNIRHMGELIGFHRKLCKRKTGSDALPRWLASYQGRNEPSKKRWCQPGDGTHRVMDLRRKLISALERRPRPKPNERALPQLTAKR
jgi:hypothetical protein